MAAAIVAMLTYLCHAAPKCNPPVVVKDAFCSDKPVHALVCILVNERAQLSFNLKLDSPARNFLYVLIANDVHEEKIGHVLGQLLDGFNTGDAGFPRTQYVLGVRFSTGWRLLADASLLISPCFGRRLAARVLCLDGRLVLAIEGRVYVGVNALLENKIGVGR